MSAKAKASHKRGGAQLARGVNKLFVADKELSQSLSILSKKGMKPGARIVKARPKIRKAKKDLTSAGNDLMRSERNHKRTTDSWKTKSTKSRKPRKKAASTKSTKSSKSTKKTTKTTKKSKKGAKFFTITYTPTGGSAKTYEKVPGKRPNGAALSLVITKIGKAGHAVVKHGSKVVGKYNISKSKGPFGYKAKTAK